MNLKKKFFAGLMMVVMLAVVLLPSFAMAQITNADDCSCAPGYTVTLHDGFYRCEDGSGDVQACFPSSDYVDDDMDLVTTIVNLIDLIMGFLGFIAVIIILIGGFQWMTAAGDDGKVGTAKKTLSAGVIGLVIVLAAWGIARFVINLFV